MAFAATVAKQSFARHRPIALIWKIHIAGVDGGLRLNGFRWHLLQRSVAQPMEDQNAR
jgi:hypothetical protein